MENKVNLVEIAGECRKAYIERCVAEDHCNYESTLYCAILEDDTVMTSRVPSILKYAKQCILIHECLKTDRKYNVNEYLVQFINEEGCVFENMLDERTKLFVHASFIDMSVCNRNLFFELPPFDEKIKEIWKLYRMSQKYKTCSEIEMFATLKSKEREVERLNQKLKEHEVMELYLKEQIKAYETLLDEVKAAVEKKEM